MYMVQHDIDTGVVPATQVRFSTPVPPTQTAIPHAP
jgi:hypothetical protein